MRPAWKYVGLAGLAGVAATGVVVARRRRAQQDYDPDELRAKLHRRLAETGREEPAGPPAPAGPAEPPEPADRCGP